MIEEKLNFDEIFPKEVRERAAWYAIWEISKESSGDMGNGPTLIKALQKACWHFPRRIFSGCIVAIVAYAIPDNHTSELACVRVRLGLTVEIIENED